MSWAYEVATGKRHAIMTHEQDSRAARWRSDCGDPTRNPAQSLLGALSGSKPACRFARSPGDGNAPGDGDWPTSATVSTVLGGAQIATNISNARYSPDRSRILFRQLDYPSAWESWQSPEDPDHGDYWVVRADGTDLRRLSESVSPQTPQVWQARWNSNTSVVLDFGSGWDRATVTDEVSRGPGGDCWVNADVKTAGEDALVHLEGAFRLGAAACPPPVVVPDPKPEDPQPTTPTTPTTPAQQTQAEQTQIQLQQIKPVVVTPTGPAITPAKVLAVGTKLGGKKKNLLTVKFTSPAGYGARVSIALRDGGKVLASADLSIEQAKTGYVRLKLSAKSRKLLTKSKGRVTVRVVPLSDG